MKPPKIAPIVIKGTIGTNGSPFDCANSAYLKACLQARGIPAPTTKQARIDRLVRWCDENRVPFTFTVA